MTYQIFVQSLAIIALIIWTASYHFKTRKLILLGQLLSITIWAIHFSLLGAYTAVALNVINIFKLTIFSAKRENNWASKQYLLYIVISLLIISTLFTFSGWWSIFALVGAIFAAIATWQNNPNKIRFLFLPSHLAWIIYDLAVGSFGGAISEIIFGISAIVSLITKNIKHLKK